METIMKPWLAAISCAAALAGCAGAPVQGNYENYNYGYGTPYDYDQGPVYYGGPIYYDYPGYYSPGVVVAPPVIVGRFGDRDLNRRHGRDVRGGNRWTHSGERWRLSANQSRNARQQMSQLNRASPQSARGLSAPMNSVNRRDTMARPSVNRNTAAHTVTRPAAPQS